MKKFVWLLVMAMVISIMTPAFAAPLFPDVPEQHWARDAVADLAAKGILEGYPDGTFKGDRAATRWEMAMALQRFLAKMEAEHATFATKADLEALRALVNNLKDELDALGVRVKNLEENVSAIDKRVTELERITFEGDFTTRFVTIGLRNNGRTGGFWANNVGSVNAIDFCPATFIGVPVIIGNYPGTIAYTNLRPLVNGASFTAKSNLGVKIKVSKDVDANVRFAAFSSLGDSIIDRYWGVSAPYLSNIFTGNGIITQVQAQNNVPWTRMTFDKLWFEHKPTNTVLIAGAIEKTNFDNFMVSNVPNPNIGGRDRSRYEEMQKEKKSLVYAFKYYEDDDTYLPFYGLKVNGKTHFISDMIWEGMYTKLPDINPAAATLAGADVTPHLVGVNFAWKIKDQYTVKINFASVTENSTIPVGADYYRTPLMGNAGNNFALAGGNWANIGGAWIDLTGGSWINPLGQTGNLPMGPAVAGTAAGLGRIGTQLQYMYGLSVNHRFEPSNIRVVLQGAQTSYKPTKISTYKQTGNHFRGGIGWTNDKNTFDLDLEYIYTDPYYDPYQVQYQAGGLVTNMFPVFSYFGGAYQIHDSDLYPNNRHGIKFGGEYRWKESDGRANLRVEWLRQVRTSSAQADVNGILNGYRPGFIEPVFNILALNNPGTLDAESPYGTVFHLGAGIEHKFSPSPFKGSVQYDYYNFKRNSAFAVNTIPAINNVVDLRNSVFKLGLAYAFNDRFTLKGGVDWTTLRGYHVMYNPLFNLQNAGTTVINTTQFSPVLGFDYEVGKNTKWCLDVRYYSTKDNLAQDFLGVANTNPYSFTGLQLMTQFKVKF